MARPDEHGRAGPEGGRSASATVQGGPRTGRRVCAAFAQLELDQTLIKELPEATSLTSRGGVRGLIVMTPQAAYLRAGNAWAQQENVTEIVVGGT